MNSVRTQPGERAARPVWRPTGAAEQTLQQSLYGILAPASRTALQEQLGYALLRLHAQRFCTSVVAEFKHVLRAYADAKEVHNV